MLKSFAIGVLLICVSCTQTNSALFTQEIETTAKMQIAYNFDWLLGKWKRSNESAGKHTFEIWEKVNDTEYFGVGYTLQDGDTISHEEIKLIKVNNRWDFIVTLPEEKDPIAFKGISQSANHYICENPQNDFPTKIRYWRTGNVLHASISGDEMEIPFEFVTSN